MSDWEQQKNDGWEEVEYEFGLRVEGDNRVSHILNEACHVFFHHKDGNWKKIYKEKYSKELSLEFAKYPELSGRATSHLTMRCTRQCTSCLYCGVVVTPHYRNTVSLYTAGKRGVMCKTIT